MSKNPMASTVVRPENPLERQDALHRLTARLATLDLDPTTLEILTAVLTADLDLRDTAQA
jgi:hypothetical protein